MFNFVYQYIEGIHYGIKFTVSADKNVKNEKKKKKKKKR